MSIISTFPALLWILALAIIPILVHLFARSRPPSYQFSDTVFLGKLLKKTARIRKPQDWLTLLFRTLAALALLAAILHPLLISQGKEDNKSDKNVIIIIDQSASMAAKEGNSSRFELAQAEAKKLLNELEPTRANVIWARSNTQSSFPEPAPNIDYLKQELLKATALQEEASTTASIELAIKQLLKMPGSREIYFLSDFQKSSWQQASITLPESIKLTKINVAKAPRANSAILSVASTPAAPVFGQETNITARVANFSDKNQRLTVYLNAAGSRKSQPIDVPAWSHADVTFQTTFTEVGQSPVTVTIDEDSFPADDSRHLVISVRESLKLTSLSKTASPSTEILDRVANSLPWLSHQTVSNLTQTSAGGILFLHDWDGSQVGTLKALLEDNTVIVSPGLQCDSKALQKLLALKQGTSTLNRSTNKEGWSAQIADASSPVFEIFSSGEFGNPASGNFFNRIDLPSKWLSAANLTTLLKYSDGTPALVKHFSQKNPLLLWNLPFAPKQSNWANQDPFLPFIAELFLHVQPLTLSTNIELLSGGPLSWKVPHQLDASAVKLTANDTEISTTTHTGSNGTNLVSTDPAYPSIFSWRVGNNIAHLSYSNFPTEESDLRTLNPDDISIGSTEASDAILRSHALSEGIPLWPWFLAAACLFLLAESISATPRTSQQTA